MFTSPFPDVEIPHVSVYDSIFGTLEEKDLARVALVDPESGEETSFGELRNQVNAVGGALAARGVGVGTVLGLLCPNTPAFASVFHGALRIGAVLTTVNTMYTTGEIAKQLADAGATWLITVSGLLPQAQEAAEAVGIGDERIIVLDGAEGYADLGDLLIAGEAPPEVEFDPATHIAVLPYSSGTAGEPKGVKLSHRNLVANVEQCRGIIDVTEDDRVLAVLPFFHIYGMTVLLNLALRQRARLVTMPKFDLVEFLELIQRHQCSYIFIAPPIAVALAKHPVVDRYDISSVRTMLSGAAPLDGETGEAAARRLNARMLQGYGMTEMSPVSHVIPPDAAEIPVSSVGVLIPNQEAKLVDVATGEMVTFGPHTARPAVSLEDAVNASCAVPLVYPPIPIDGGIYVDGGARSGSNADLMVGMDVVIAITPMDRAIGPLRSAAQQLEDLGLPYLVVSPDAAAKAAIGKNVLDPAARPPSARAGYAQAAAEIDRIRSLWT